MKHILVIEDDKSLSQGITLALTSNGFKVSQAFDGEEGVHKAKSLSPNLIILDIMIPHMNGFEVIAELRKEGMLTPILVLSARTQSRDKVRGLDLGADDYLTKPFDLDEFLARVRRHLREVPLDELVFGKCSYDFDKRMLFDADKDRISITTKELLLLEYFLKRSERIVTREAILLAVWGEDYDGTDRTVDNLVVSLRKKIGEMHIETVRGQGYRFLMKV